MANTVIALKKSAVPSAAPTNLANGELALNFADGKLFYKHANGSIIAFNTSGGNSYGTVNANGTLIVAGVSSDILTLIPGNNIQITGDAINDRITISATGGGTGGASVNIGDNPPVSPNVGDLWWSSVFGSMFIYYNDGTSTQWVETTPGSVYANTVELIATSAFAKANDANLLAYNVGVNANAYLISVIAGANTAVGAGANAFTSATIAGANTISIAAFAKANAALPNTSGVSFVGDLNFPSGNVGIKTSSPAYPLDVVGNINSSNTVFAVHFDNVSDISLKENIKPINNSIDIITQLNPVSFNWKSTGQTSYGLIAQEVEKIIPSIVHRKADDTKTVNYIEIIAFLIKAVKDLQEQIDDINNK